MESYRDRRVTPYQRSTLIGAYAQMRLRRPLGPFVRERPLNLHWGVENKIIIIIIILSFIERKNPYIHF